MYLFVLQTIDKHFAASSAVRIRLPPIAFNRIQLRLFASPAVPAVECAGTPTQERIPCSPGEPSVRQKCAHHRCNTTHRLTTSHEECVRWLANVN